uniref:RAB42, member RAS oncogene family n=1 Tax=Buteo japonicus TaxID=224669 RepID=A0A8B9ZD00_9AVES
AFVTETRQRDRFRVIVLGDAAVGKSSLLRCFAEGPGGGGIGVATPCPTVGVEFYSRTIPLPPAGKAKLQLWDTAGQERSITRSFYRSAAGVLLVFDLTNRASFEHVPEWYREAAGDRPPTFVLVGHKCDLAAERAVSAEEAGHLAATLGPQYSRVPTGPLAAGSPTGEEPRSKAKGVPRERSPWGCLVSPGSSSKLDTGLPKQPSAPPAAEGQGNGLGAHWELGKAASSAARSLPTSLLGLPTAGQAGYWEQGSSGDVAAGHGRVRRLWLQGTDQLWWLSRDRAAWTAC